MSQRAPGYRFQYQVPPTSSAVSSTMALNPARRIRTSSYIPANPAPTITTSTSVVLLSVISSPSIDTRPTVSRPTVDRFDPDRPDPRSFVRDSGDPSRRKLRANVVGLRRGQTVTGSMASATRSTERRRWSIVGDEWAVISSSTPASAANSSRYAVTWSGVPTAE